MGVVRMIQIYVADNTNYDVNGDAVLLPDTCTLDTSSWQVSLTHPRDADGRWELIQDGAVLKLPTFLADDQLYRIINTEVTDSGVTATAQPIFFDSAGDVMLVDTRPTDKSGQAALDILTQGTKYSGTSDITAHSTAYYQMRNLMEALTGDDDNVFVNRWGGEVMYDNYTVIINERLGADNGALLAYGKNIPADGMRITEDVSALVTRIYPRAYNGRALSGSGYVDSPLVGNYPTVHQAVMEFSDVRLAEDVSGDDTEGLIVCEDQSALDEALRAKCAEQWAADVDKPAVTVEVNMVLLADTVNYADVKDLERVSLGDTVHVRNQRLGIDMSARVKSLVYDCVRDKVQSVTIGSALYDYVSDTSSTIQAADAVIDKGTQTLMANRIAGVINLLNASLRAQKNVAQRQDVRAILFEDLDESSPTYGALCIGTQGIQIAKERNAEGTDWKWGTAIDFQSVNADYIITGILTDRNGKFYFNLDTGELAMADGTFAGTINGAAINGGTITGATIKTDKDLHVGNNIYINSEVQTQKFIYFTADSFIRMFLTSGWEYLTIESGRVALRSTQLGQAEVYAWTEPDMGVINAGMAVYRNSGGTNVQTASFRLEGDSGDVEVTANGTFSGNKQYSVTSDIRLKENIEDIDLTGILDIMRVKKYNLIGNPEKTVGVIAQDFIGTEYEDIIIKKDKRGYYAVDYNVILMAIVQKLKEVMEDDNTDQNRAAFDA